LVTTIAHARQEAIVAELLDLAAIDAHAAKIVGGDNPELAYESHRAILVRRLAGS
jgi:hypothetical protein